MMAIIVHPALVYFYVHTIFVTRGAAWKEENEEEEKKTSGGGSKKSVIDDGECFHLRIRVRASYCTGALVHGARRRLFHP